jgi:hypothetical protein
MLLGEPVGARAVADARMGAGWVAAVLPGLAMRVRAPVREDQPQRERGGRIA